MSKNGSLLSQHDSIETPSDKAGTIQGAQRYRCQSLACSTKTFMRDYRYQAYVPGVKKQLVDMAINGSGIRDTARVLKISKGTVISTLKKSRPAGSVPS